MRGEKPEVGIVTSRTLHKIGEGLRHPKISSVTWMNPGVICSRVFERVCHPPR